MTQGGQGEPPSDLEMERGFTEKPELNETESMQDDQDPEVGNKAAFTASVFTGYL